MLYQLRIAMVLLLNLGTVCVYGMDNSQEFLQMKRTIDEQKVTMSELLKDFKQFKLQQNESSAEITALKEELRLEKNKKNIVISKPVESYEFCGYSKVESKNQVEVLSLQVAELMREVHELKFNASRAEINQKNIFNCLNNLDFNRSGYSNTIDCYTSRFIGIDSKATPMILSANSSEN